MEIEVWTTTTECWACDEQMVIWYPPAVGSAHGGSWEPIGEHLAELPDCPIDRAYSEEQGQDVWGNICDSCGEYYGNFYAYRDAQLAVSTHGREAVHRGTVEEYDVIRVDIPVACRVCGADEVELPAGLCEHCLPTPSTPSSRRRGAASPAFRTLSKRE